MKKIIINENQFNELVDTLNGENGYSIEDVTGNHGSYRLTDLRKLNGYVQINPQISGLKTDIYVDCSESYKQDGHPLLLFVVNGNNVNEYIPFVVCEHPYIMDDADDIDYNIDYEDLFAVQDFIQLNLSFIVALANKKITIRQFLSLIRSVNTKDIENVCEEVKLC